MALRKARAAVASAPEIEGAAEDLLGRGNAVDAVVAGVFAACAISPGVLLGPVQLLVGGAGAGLLAIDGRVRQPGAGAPRPRGFTSAEEVPDAARVGVPWLPAAMSVAIATMGTATFNQVLAPAVSLAKGTPRAEVLKRIASRGPIAIEERPLGGELLAAAGRPSGGLLTTEDLASPRPEVTRASRVVVTSQVRDATSAKRPGFAGGELSRKKKTAGGEPEPMVLVTFPWTRVESGRPVAPAHDVDVARVRAVAAVDRNATFAVACWDEATDGVLLADLGLRAPFSAEPVRRGQTRVRPGDTRPAAGPVALVGTPAAPELALCAFGAADAYDVLAQAIAGLAADERIEAHGEARLVALAHAHGTASVLRG
jgi:gamma-glutamyltranspeptidase/glutathione hydrolase